MHKIINEIKELINAPEEVSNLRHKIIDDQNYTTVVFHYKDGEISIIYRLPISKERFLTEVKKMKCDICGQITGKDWTAGKV